MSEYTEIMEVAARFYNAGNYAVAERLCRDVLQSKGQDRDALHMLGRIAYQLGRHHAALRLIEQAVSSGPADAQLYNTLGIFLEARGDNPAAIEAYRHAISIDKTNAQAYHNMAIAQQAGGDIHGAIENCVQAITHKPDFAQAYNTLGFCQKSARKLDEASESFRAAIRYNPNLAEAFNHLGSILSQQGAYQRAAEHLQNAVRICDNYAEAHNNLGIALRALGRDDEAITAFQRAVSHEPDFLQAHYNLANALRKRGDCDRAISHYDRAIELKPDFAWSHWNLSHALLLKGDFQRGWRQYAWRHNPDVGVVTYPHKFDIPRWQGGDLTGKRLLVHYEQGLGDNIQFIRYLPMVKALGPTVIYESPGQLFNLLRGFGGIDELLVAKDTRPDTQCDFIVSPLDLPGIFGTTLETIPVGVPYITADPVKAQAWRRSLKTQNVKVGIVWAGSPAHGADAERSCSFEYFRRLAHVPGVSLFSLQKGAARLQLHQFDSNGIIPDIGSEFGDFSDTAAAIAALDLVVSVDTAVAHLAGAMGKPVWLLLPHAPDWRWMLHRDDSPWYPTMRLFRQRQTGNWTDVFDLVAGHLRHVIGSRGDKTC